MRIVPTALACTGIVTAAASGQFTEASYSEAFDRAVKEDKLFLVHATAVWCGPCKMMDRDTYANDEVQTWMDAHTVAIKVDVDDEPDRAKELGIRAMPTMVVFKQGEEFDRVTGYRGPDDFLGWQEGVKVGKSSLDAMKERAGAREFNDEGVVDVQARMQIAEQLMNGGEFEAATEEYLWLWHNMLDHNRSCVGVRSSFMASEMGTLAKAHPEAMEAFTQLRDEVENRLRQEPSWDDLSDWIVLNLSVLDDREPVLAWVDRNMEDEEGKKSIRRFSYRIDRLLEEEQRWRQLGSMMDDPMVPIRQEHQMILMTENNPQMAEHIDTMLQRFNMRYAKKVATTTVSLIAADRLDEAIEVVRESIELRPEAQVTEALEELFAYEPQLRNKARDAFAGREDLPDALAQAMN